MFQLPDFSSPDFIPRFIGYLLGFVIGTTFHEFMHAYSALRLGDDTAKRMGRITLNPAAHFDPVGFILMVMLAMGIGFLAWGRPVQVNPYALRFGRRGMSIVAVAGPITNLVFATALTPLYKLTEVWLNSGSPQLLVDIHKVILYMIYVNILLFCFNLIPIPPLDGFNILSGVLPNAWVSILEPIRTYSLPILLAAVFFVPYIGNALNFDLNPVGIAIGPVATLLSNLFLGG